MLVLTFAVSGAGNCVEIDGVSYVYARTAAGSFVCPARCAHWGGPLHLARLNLAATGFADQLGRANRLGLVNNELVVQEYAAGTEYVVDVFSHNGTHSIVDVCRYRKIDNGPHMAIYESMAWVPPSAAVVPVLTRYARQVLDAVGVRYGTAHVEIMLTRSGPLLIEVGVRPHGGGQPRFCRAATGDSQVDRAVRYFTGAGDIPAGYRLRQHMLVVFLISRAAGVVRDCSSLAAVRHLPSHHASVINIRAGDRVGVTDDLFATFELGFVVLAHPDEAQLLADHQAIRRAERDLVVESAASRTC